MEVWITAPEAAKYLGYSYTYFMRDIKTIPGFPKPFRRPTAHGVGHAKYKVADLDAWRQENVQAA